MKLKSYGNTFVHHVEPFFTCRVVLYCNSASAKNNDLTLWYKEKYFRLLQTTLKWPIVCILML